MKIYTRTGDSGTTSLVGGQRVAKDDPRVEAYGALDELASQLGLLHDQIGASNALLLSQGKALLGKLIAGEPAARQFTAAELQQQLRTILSRLMDGEALLAATGTETSKTLPQLAADEIAKLEMRTDELLDGLPELRKFTLPCGHPLVSQAHVCRAVCRRAERRIATAAGDFELPATVSAYVNRLSDYLYALTRRLSRQLGITESEWTPGQ